MLPRKSQRRCRRAVPRRVRLERLEARQLLAADSIGVTPLDTGEFLLGTVAVTPVFFESNGQIDPETQNWSAGEIESVLNKVSDGVNWWSDTLDTLNTVHSLDFVIDDTFALDPFETGYEPIDRSSSAFNLYVGEFVTAQGYGDANSIEDAVKQFNHAQRLKHGTDWSFTIFVIDASDDGDGLFAAGGQFAAAFAFAGGLFFMTPSTRPTSTFTHEMGHIFWARDEYSGGGSYLDRRGYYNTQNLNAADNPTPGFQQEISIMRGGVPLTAAYEAHVSPDSTLAMVGWRDSDGDGVFDLADVPLDLDAVGYFDADTSEFRFSGTASAVPMANQNSSGTQSDITLNQVSQLQYSIDGGAWQSAAQPESQRTEFDLAVAVDSNFTDIRFRAIDISTGITSEIIQGDSLNPAVTAASVSAAVFLDENNDGQRDLSELALPATTVTVRHTDGSPLFGGTVLAADHSDGRLPDLTNVTLTAEGVVSDPDVGAFELPSEERVFQSFDIQRQNWVDAWSSKVKFRATFDQPVGQATVNVLGLGDASFARLEAYDASGQMIARVTSDGLSEGEQLALEVTDPNGSIASILAFGHAETSIAITGIQFGFADTYFTDSSGVLAFSNLPDGDYQLDFATELVIHQIESTNVQVSFGSSSFNQMAARRVDSPRYNSASPGDANGDGSISSQDALVIINDMSRNGSRTLQASETEGFSVDVSNDGLVTARDALLVINLLGRTSGESEFIDSSGEISTPLSGKNDGMLNSAGDAVDDARSMNSTADTTDQPLVANAVDLILGSKVSDFSANSRAGFEITTTQHDFGAEKASEVEQPIADIQVRIAEPFENLPV